MDEGPFDERYVRFREHVESKDELKAAIGALEVAHARMSSSLMHLPEKVDTLTTSINALAQKMQQPAPSPAQDQTLLMMHRLLDSAATKNGGAGALLERAFLLIGGGGVGWIIMQFTGAH